jgi:hypothetical protein
MMLSLLTDAVAELSKRHAAAIPIIGCKILCFCFPRKSPKRRILKKDFARLAEDVSGKERQEIDEEW